MSSSNKATNKNDNTKKTKKLQNWKFPKIPIHIFYRQKSLSFFSSNAIYDFEKTITLKPSDRFRSFYLLSPGIRTEKHNFLHFGLVQVAIKPLVRDGLDVPVTVCLRDARHRNSFSNSLLALVESNLSHGPIYFNCYPSFSVSLRDNTFLEALTLVIQTTGIPLAVTVRVVCKAMVDLSAEYLVEPVLGKTTYYSAISGSEATTEWDEVVLQVDDINLLAPTPLANNLVMVRSASTGCGGNW